MSLPPHSNNDGGSSGGGEDSDGFHPARRDSDKEAAITLALSMGALHSFSSSGSGSGSRWKDFSPRVLHTLLSSSEATPQVVIGLLKLQVRRL